MHAADLSVTSQAAVEVRSRSARSRQGVLRGVDCSAKTFQGSDVFGPPLLLGRAVVTGVTILVYKRTHRTLALEPESVYYSSVEFVPSSFRVPRLCRAARFDRRRGGGP